MSDAIPPSARQVSRREIMHTVYYRVPITWGGESMFNKNVIEVTLELLFGSDLMVQFRVRVNGVYELPGWSFDLREVLSALRVNWTFAEDDEAQHTLSPMLGGERKINVK